ncbi:hypothetical protein V5O48_016882 [Marasmius crinis-equi]|uniref:Uncharacterized protein n=1 Tax=Marasmius crinis-equi TaxID=585013 RepID=A0ABR3EQR4_9AGAR
MGICGNSNQTYNNSSVRNRHEIHRRLYGGSAVVHVHVHECGSSRSSASTSPSGTPASSDARTPTSPSLQTLSPSSSPPTSTTTPEGLKDRAKKMTQSQRYEYLLLDYQLGSPQWKPSPQRTLDEEYVPEIGAVGLFSDGLPFDTLFNITLPLDSPVNRDGVPEGVDPPCTIHQRWLSVDDKYHGREAILFRPKAQTSTSGTGSLQSLNHNSEDLPDESRVDRFGLSLSAIDFDQDKHPCQVINNFALALVSRTRPKLIETGCVAFSHDEDWMGIVNDSDAEFLDNTEIIRRMSSRLKFVVEQDTIFPTSMSDAEKKLVQPCSSNSKPANTIIVLVEFHEQEMSPQISALKTTLVASDSENIVSTSSGVPVTTSMSLRIPLTSCPVLSPVDEAANSPSAHEHTSPKTTTPVTFFASKTPISVVKPFRKDRQPRRWREGIRRPEKFPERPRTADTTASTAAKPSISHYEPSPHVRVWRAASTRPVPRIATAHIGLSSLNNSHAQGTCGSASTAANMSPIMETNGSAKAENSNTVKSGAGPVILAGALQSVVQEEYWDDTLIDDYLLKIYCQACSSESIVSKFVAAGTVPTLVTLLKWRSDAGEEGLESLIPVLMTLGTLSQDPITSNIMLRTNALNTIMELFLSPSDPIAVLSVWCLTRATHNVETATGLVKQGLPSLILKHGLRKRQRRPLVARYAAWCLGNLIHSDLTAELFCSPEHLTEVLQYLEQCSMPGTPSEDTCSALFLLARVSRSVKTAKELTGAECIRHLMHHLKTSNNPDILRWSARAVGCLMRPNSGEMAKVLLRAGVASGLARLPRVLPADEVTPLGCFAFAIQRFSYAEWGGGTRKALVDEGVVDSLLGALRNAAEVPNPKIHVELALAVSALGDVGGSSVRKEITDAGGLMILKKLASAAGPGTEIAKTCNMAVTSIAGNIFTRHAASARTALSHSWSGGCPEYQPPCPLMFRDCQPTERLVRAGLARTGGPRTSNLTDVTQNFRGASANLSPSDRQHREPLPLPRTSAILRSLS